MFAAIIPALLPVFGNLLKSWFPDPEQAAKAQQELTLALMAQAAEINRAAADVVKAEAQSEHWLAACWRPILMLTFGALIVARWLGYSAPNISETESLALWDIVRLGLGGYVLGRSAEKIVPSVAAAISGK